MDRAGRLRRAVAADTARERELLEQTAQPFLVLGNIAVDLGIRALEIDIGEHRRRAVSRPREEDNVKVVLFYQAVEVHIDQAHPGIGAPMAQQTPLDMLRLQRFAKQRIVVANKSCRLRDTSWRPSSVANAAAPPVPKGCRSRWTAPGHMHLSISTPSRQTPAVSTGSWGKLTCGGPRSYGARRHIHCRQSHVFGTDQRSVANPQDAESEDFVNVTVGNIALSHRCFLSPGLRAAADGKSPNER